MLYARQVCNTTHEGEGSGFNAASGNAIRATSMITSMMNLYTSSFNAASGNAIRATQRPISMATAFVGVSMPQAAMLYARLLAGVAVKAATKFQCRKRQCYTRDSDTMSYVKENPVVSMPQAAMLYARQKEVLNDTGDFSEFQCRKRQCYTRDMKFNNGDDFDYKVSMPQAAMLYARLCLSQPANLLGPDRDFHNLPVFPSKRGYFSWTPCFQNLRKHHVSP